MRTVLNLQQGTDAWLAARASSDGTASEAPASQGKSKHQSRTDLLNQRKTGVAKAVDSATQALFNKGHEAEEKARPIAEGIIGDELSPTTISLEIEGLTLLASLDGITFDDEVIFEHKLYSESLAEQIRSGNLEEHYTIQMDQELLVSGAKRCLFMCSDGTENKCAWMWYESTQEKFNAVIAGWKQFKADLATYVPQEFKEALKADAVEAMPSPSIVVKGELVSSNLVDLSPVFDRFLSETKTELQTDEDFALGESNAKTSREAAKALKATAKAVIDQIAPVSQVVAVIEVYASKFDALGLKLEKAVKEQKETIRNNAILMAKQNWSEYVASLEVEIKPIRLIVDAPNFATAVKGVRTIAGLHGKVNDALAAGKVIASEQAQDIRLKLAWCKEHAEGMSFLFPDLQQIISKPMDDFTLLMNTRINAHKDAEAERVRKAAEELAVQQQSAQATKATPIVDQVESVQEIKPVIATSNPAIKTAHVHFFGTKPGQDDLVKGIAFAFGADETLARTWLEDAFGIKAA